MSSLPSEAHDDAAGPRRKVAYIWSKRYEQVCNHLPSNVERSSRIHSLIRAYGLDRLIEFLLPHRQRTDNSVIEPEPASEDDLCTFHDSEYIEFLLNPPSSAPSKKRKRRSSSSSHSSCSSKDEDDSFKKFGLEYDCPPFDQLPDYVSLLGGAAIQSAALLTSYNRVINWDGGRHHALRSQASGYCYLADIPLSILRLLQTFKKVLYVDLDAHHGDGVEAAFRQSGRVTTLSFHVFEPGFFPGTGGWGSQGDRGVWNVPLEMGMKGVVWEGIVRRCVGWIWGLDEPECLVVQCGCDGLVGDPHQALQLTTYSFQRVICHILSLAGSKPVLLLGGGGYNPVSAAKHFALLTACVLGKTLGEEIPVEAEYWEELEREGGIHVGRDLPLTDEGKKQMDKYCAEFRDRLDGRHRSQGNRTC